MENTKSVSQKAFNHVLKKLNEQGCMSIDGGSCKYFGPNNTRCAAGWLMKKGMKEDIREGVPAYINDKFLQDQFKELASTLFLGKLQSAHDSAAITVGKFLLGFNNNMRRLAREYNLIFEEKYVKKLKITLDK